MPHFSRLPLIALVSLSLLTLPSRAHAQMRGGSAGVSGGFGGSNFSGGGSFGGNSLGGSSFGGNSFSGGGMSGSGFGGGMGGNSFGGNSFGGGGNFSGGGAVNGNSFGGGSFSGSSGFSGSSAFGSSNADPFAASRANPMAQGQYGGLANGTGGRGSMYGGNMTGAGQLGGLMGNNRFGNNLGGMNGMNNMSGMNSNMNSNVRQPGFVLRPNFSAPAVISEEVTTRVQRVLTTSPSVPNGSKISLGVEGDTLVMRGQVGTEDEKRLAETIIRLEPGVHAVRNELQVGIVPEPKSRAAPAPTAPSEKPNLH